MCPSGQTMDDAWGLLTSSSQIKLNRLVKPRRGECEGEGSVI